jgi:hypothetical protein
LWTVGVTWVPVEPGPTRAQRVVRSTNTRAPGELGGWTLAGAALFVSFLSEPALHYDTSNDDATYLLGASFLTLLIAAVPLSRARE